MGAFNRNRNEKPDTSYSAVSTDPVEGNPSNDIAQFGDVAAYNGKTYYAVLHQLICFFGLLLLTFFAIAFWVYGVVNGAFCSYAFANLYPYYTKTFAAVFTLIGTVLSTVTFWLFSRILHITMRQQIIQSGVKISKLEFWSKLSNKRWLLNPRHGRLKLSIFTVVFALAFGALTSAFATLLTPSWVPVTENISTQDINLSAPDLQDWIYANGYNTLSSSHCNGFSTYQNSSSEYTEKLTFATCPASQDLERLIRAGLSNIESYYAVEGTPVPVELFDTIFNGTTGGAMPLGWNGLYYFYQDVPPQDVPVLESRGYYTYAFQQQGIWTNVHCEVLNKSNITWIRNEPLINLVFDADQEVYLQGTFYPNPYTGGNETSYFVSTDDFVTTFGTITQPESSEHSIQFEFAGFGSYASDAMFPNMACYVKPDLGTWDVIYNSEPRMFFVSNYESQNVSSTLIPLNILQIISNVFVTSINMMGNSAIDSILGLLNTRDYFNGNAYGSIEWASTMELFIQGMVQYEASYQRMLFAAQTAAQSSSLGRYDVTGIVLDYLYGYDKGYGAIVYVLVLQSFVLISALVVIRAGWKTGVRRVPKFDPTSPTHLIIASVAGGHHGTLPGIAQCAATGNDHVVMDTTIKLAEQGRFHEVVPDQV